MQGASINTVTGNSIKALTTFMLARGEGTIKSMLEIEEVGIAALVTDPPGSRLQFPVAHVCIGKSARSYDPGRFSVFVWFKS